MGNSFPAGNTVTAVARTPNNLDLFVVGHDGGVQSTYWDASGGWGELPPAGPILSSPRRGCEAWAARSEERRVAAAQIPGPAF